MNETLSDIDVFLNGESVAVSSFSFIIDPAPEQLPVGVTEAPVTGTFAAEGGYSEPELIELMLSEEPIRLEFRSEHGVVRFGEIDARYEYGTDGPGLTNSEIRWVASAYPTRFDPETEPDPETMPDQQ